MTIPEAAQCILLECFPHPKHYREIAKDAFERGFKGKRLEPDFDPSKVAESFRRMMGQRPDIFEQAGDGHYTITEEFMQSGEDE